VAKCVKCGRQAVIKIPYARLWLCKDHFIEFFEARVLKAIKRYGLIKKGDKVLVAVSGGKDSASLLSALKKASEELDFNIIALHIDLGIGEYSKGNREAVVRLASQLGIKLLVFDVLLI
jgi:tRNA(Ile)-lysidine synthase TilS/MesJ